MKQRKFIVPEFGPLAGMRVVGAGSLIAMPFAASMLAEFGAEFIQIERPQIGDTYRQFAPVIERNGQKVSAAWLQEARNRLSMTLELNMKNGDSRKMFFDLIREADVFMESMVWLEKLGIKDEELMSINPSLIIVHISGFGRPEFGGSAEMCAQASYDIIGQAFSGYALYNGYEDRPPLMAKPALNDYTTALFSVFGILSAYLYASKTGLGQIIDVSQFEAQAKLMREAYVLPALGAGNIQRSGNKSNSSQPWDVFATADERYIALGAVGEPVFRRFVDAIGLDLELFKYSELACNMAAIQSEKGKRFCNIVEQWFRARTADEIETIMHKARVPCSRINEPSECLNNPHFLQRGDFISYTDQTLDKNVTAFGVVPKLSLTPGHIWRGAPYLGQDTDNILREVLNYDSEEIARLHSNGII